MFVLVEAGVLTLATKISTLLEPELVRHLHFFEGQYYSNDLTVAHLLYQTSGLPNAFEEAEIVRQLAPHFKPGSCNQAYYTDINFDLLGRMIEKVTGQTLAKAFQERIIAPLQLTNSYLLNPKQAGVPPVYYQHTRLERPQFLMSAGASGGGMTTAHDLLKFIHAFTGDKLFLKLY